MSEPRVILYTRDWCGFCSAATRLLKSANASYEEHNLTGKWEELEAVKARYGHPTVPLVIVDGQLIGGYNELNALVRSKGAAAIR